MGARCKPWEQLHYLFFPCNLVGSPSSSLFLCYDIDACPDATTTVLGLDAADPPYYRKALFWVHAASRRNKSNVYVSHWLAVLTSWPFLLFCDIIFTKVFALCNMNRREGGLRGGELDNLGMRGWYRTIVADCGSNVVSAFDHHRGWDWLRCGCHCLHSVVMGSLQVIKNMSHTGEHTPARRI